MSFCYIIRMVCDEMEACPNTNVDDAKFGLGTFQELCFLVFNILCLGVSHMRSLFYYGRGGEHI